MKTLKQKVQEFRQKLHGWSVRVYRASKTFEVHPAYDKQMQRTICDIIGTSKTDLLYAQLIASAPKMRLILEHILETQTVTKEDLTIIRQTLENMDKINSRHYKFTLDFEAEKTLKK